MDWKFGNVCLGDFASHLTCDASKCIVKKVTNSQAISRHSSVHFIPCKKHCRNHTPWTLLEEFILYPSQSLIPSKMAEFFTTTQTNRITWLRETYPYDHYRTHGWIKHSLKEIISFFLSCSVSVTGLNKKLDHYRVPCHEIYTRKNTLESLHPLGCTWTQTN